MGTSGSLALSCAGHVFVLLTSVQKPVDFLPFSLLLLLTIFLTLGRPTSALLKGLLFFFSNEMIIVDTFFNAQIY